MANTSESSQLQRGRESGNNRARRGSGVARSRPSDLILLTTRNNMSNTIQATRIVTNGTPANLPLEADGCYFVAVRDESGRGASATFSLSGGQVFRMACGKGSNDEFLSVSWEQEQGYKLVVDPGNGEYTYTVKWWGV
jgi:hypothetical protein